MTKHNINLNLHTVRIGFGTKFTEDQMMYFQHFARMVLTPLKPSVGSMYMAMCADKVRREIEGESTFELCSERTFRRIVETMRDGARDGVSAADKIVSCHDVPMDILVMDWRKFDLPRLCTILGFWERLHCDVRARLISIRAAWASVAIDPCSLAFCGFRLTVDTPTSFDAVATLAMAVRNSGETSTQCFGRPGSVQIDDSYAYCSHAFHTTVHALTGQGPVEDKQCAAVRGRAERALYSLAKSRKRTSRADIGESVLFSDQWNPAKFAMLTIGEILDLVGQLIVTCYHGTPRVGVAGLTPIEQWNSLLAKGRVLYPALSKAEHRDLFGVKLKRTIGNQGINILGLPYASPELALAYASHHNTQVEVSIDEDDISVVSFLNPRDGHWHDAFPDVPGLEGISLREWIETWEYCARKIDAIHVTSQKVGEALKQFRDAA